MTYPPSVGGTHKKYWCLKKSKSAGDVALPVGIQPGRPAYAFDFSSVRSESHNPFATGKFYRFYLALFLYFSTVVV